MDLKILYSNKKQSTDGPLTIRYNYWWKNKVKTNFKITIFIFKQNWIHNTLGTNGAIDKNTQSV